MTNQHYSVDMFLAVVVTALVWHALACIQPPGSKLHIRHCDEPADPGGPLKWLLIGLIVAVLLIVGVVIIVGGA